MRRKGLRLYNQSFGGVAGAAIMAFPFIALGGVAGRTGDAGGGAGAGSGVDMIVPLMTRLSGTGVSEVADDVRWYPRPLLFPRPRTELAEAPHPLAE